MAFDKTRRFVKLTTSTCAQVGPGTYNVSDLSKPPRDLDNAYPFLSGTSRQTLGIPKDAHKFPGPGSYNIETPRKHIPGGVSIDYTDVRFKEKGYKEPESPGKYSLPSDSFKESPRETQSHSSISRGPAGKLWLTRPPRSIMLTGPSVPSKCDFGGYTYDERGVLVKIPVIEHKPTDFYNISRGETNFTTLKYKGNFWSRMKGRDDERTSVTPGPGNYEHETKKSPAQIHDEKTREAKRAAVKQPRFLEALYQQKLRQNFPAPNHYAPPKSVFDKYKYMCKYDPYKVEPPPFNQTAKRFEKDIKSETPGPAAYKIAIEQICYGSILAAPFGAFDARFKKVDDTVTPGPADYHTNVGNLAFESRRRFKDYHRKTINYLKFYQILKSISDGDNQTSCYDKYEKIDEKRCPIYHAVFKSRVDRFSKIYKHSDVPDPGAYEALSAFRTNRDRCDFLCRRLAPPFGSRASRFPVISKGIDFHVPGPSYYDLRGDISKNVKNGVICYAPREKKEDIKGPGPLRYHIHPYHTSSVLKKSFNVTLGKSKIIKDIEEMQNPWHRQSKKISCCLAVPRKRYQHCISA